MKRIIVDCGATEAIWCVLGSGPGMTVSTPGFNLAHTPARAVNEVVSEAAAKIGPGEYEIFFYAAGLTGDSPLDLTRWFPGAKVEYASDMLAAARAVLGRERGLAAILGTGANSCLYDGEKIVWKVDSGGFILGDEGSAAVLGRLFAADLIKKQVPEDIAGEFTSLFKADYPTLVRNVYGAPAPARYLGSFAPFLLSHYERSEYVRALVDGNFRAFFERALLQYEKGLPVGVVGGFGYASREILTAIGREYGIEFKVFLKSPAEGLKKYHAI